MLSRTNLSWIILILFLFLYLFFPSGSSTNDAWYYAASIKYGGEIFHPHHLLYNALGYAFCYLPVKAGADVLATLKVMNALFAVLVLAIVQEVITILTHEKFMVVMITSLTGASFSMMRYATENETYIVPLFFALLASYQFLKYTVSGENKYVLYTAVWITVSVLFHQEYFLWWMGLLAGLISFKKRSHVLNYILVSLSGPLIYLIVIFFTQGNLHKETVISYLLGVLKGDAHFGLSAMGLLLSGISLIRSFMQVHGYILNLIKSNILYIIPAVISTLLIILSLFRAPELNHKTDHNRFAWTILLIIIMLFIFALFAEGNAEFMVMIPVLSFVLVPIFTVNSKKILPLVLSGLALWNISYGLLPLHFKSHANEQFLCDVSGQTNNVIVIAYDGQLLNNMIYYQTGNINRRNIYLSPAALNIKGRDVKILEDIIEDALKAERKIYTDCIGSFATSRATIIEGRFNERFFIRYKTRVVKSWKSSLGERSVCEITGKLY